MSKLIRSYPVQSRASWKSRSGAKSRTVCCFTGKEKDAETGLDYFGARYLDKDFGMWLTPDPARQFPNLYAYTHGDPLNFKDAQGLLEYPVNYANVRSVMGNRFHPVKKEWRFHAGTDLRAATGTEMMALSNSTVHFRGNLNGYGNTMIMNAGGGFYYLYAHLSRMNVQRGETVTEGQVIAEAGNTGVGTGPHIHFEIIDMNGNENATLSQLMANKKDTRVMPGSVNLGEYSNVAPSSFINLDEQSVDSDGPIEVNPEVLLDEN